MKLQNKDIGLIVVVVAAGAALVVASTKMFGSDGGTSSVKPVIAGAPSKEIPLNAATNKPVDVPNQSAN